MEQQHFRVTAPLWYRIVGYAVLNLCCCFFTVYEHSRQGCHCRSPPWDWSRPKCQVRLQVPQQGSAKRLLLKWTSPGQALKYCARLLRRRSQYLPFTSAYASVKAGYREFLVSATTQSQKSLVVLLPFLPDIVCYTHSLDSLHNSLLPVRYHAHLLLIHRILMNKIPHPIAASLHPDILKILLLLLYFL